MADVQGHPAPAPLRTTQVTRFLACPKVFLRIALSGRACKTAEDFLSVVGEALRQMYGLAGGAMEIDAVQFDASTNQAIIGVAKEDENKLWTAASLLTNVRGQNCRLEVIASSPFLISLASNEQDLLSRVLNAPQE